MAELAKTPLNVDQVAGIFINLVEDDSQQLTCAVVTTATSWGHRFSLSVNKKAILTPAAKL
jgi:hypothetical protein